MDADPKGGHVESIADPADAAPATVGEVGAHTRRLCEVSLEILPVDGVSVVVRSGLDHREMVHATDGIVARLDDLQFVIGEGPCLDAYQQRFPVLEHDLSGIAAGNRWPGFAREATAIGARAIYAFPLQVGAAPFGVMEMYARRAGGLDHTQLVTALLIVDDVVRVVLQELTDVRLSPTADHPVPALGDAQIPQATGMVAVQLDVSIPEALAQLRALAFAKNRPIQAIAEDIVSRRLHLWHSDH